MCLTFKPIDNPDEMQVDHVNCNKSDDRLENLDWVTPKENCRRASKNGLYQGSKAVLVRDIDTGLVTEFPSMAECGRALGIKKSLIQYRLELNDGRVYPERKQYAFKKSFSGWKRSENAYSDITGFGVCKKVVARNLLTKKELEFDKLTDLAKFLGVSLPKLSSAMHEMQHPILTGLWQVKLKSDTSPWRESADPIKELALLEGQSVVTAINWNKKVKEIYICQKDCALFHRILPSTLNYRLKIGNPNTVYPNGYSYRYYKNDDGSTTSDFHVEYFF
jgi:hypothetical protein